jgi:hypothetical protein
LFTREQVEQEIHLLQVHLKETWWNSPPGPGNGLVAVVVEEQQQVVLSIPCYQVTWRSRCNNFNFRNTNSLELVVEVVVNQQFTRSPILVDQVVVEQVRFGSTCSNNPGTAGTTNTGGGGGGGAMV